MNTKYYSTGYYITYEAFRHGLPCITILGGLGFHFFDLYQQVGEALHGALNRGFEHTVIGVASFGGDVYALVKECFPCHISCRGLHEIRLVLGGWDRGQCLREDGPLSLNDAADNEVSAKWAAARDIAREERANEEYAVGVRFFRA